MKMNKDLRKAIKELEEYLERNPHMKGYQDTIDNVLDKAGNDPQKRLQAFNFLLQDNLEELSTEFKLLKYKLDGVLK